MTLIQKQKQPYIIYPDPVVQPQPFEVHPHDLPKCMTFVEAEEAVKDLGEGWCIPTLPQLKLMYERKNEIRGFCTTNRGSGAYPVYWWSCSELRGHPSLVWNVCLSDGDYGWATKDVIRLSCRPVRLVAAPSPSPSLG